MMGRKLVGLIGLFGLFVLAGCTNSTTVPDASVPNTAVSSTNTPIPDTTVSSESPTVAIPPTSTLAPDPSPISTPTPPPLDLSITNEDIFLYPVPEIYAGDRVTFQILAHVPDNVDPQSVTVHVLVDYQDVAEGSLSTPNLAGDAVGLFEWAWDTSEQIGEHLVHVILDRFDAVTAGDENQENNQVALTVPVRNPQELPPNERNATWVTAETDCCYVMWSAGRPLTGICQNYWCR